MKHRLHAHEVRMVAVAADVDPRTVRRFLEGRPVSAMPLKRICAAMVSLGFENPAREGAR
jgi:hypothetical protein